LELGRLSRRIAALLRFFGLAAQFGIVFAVYLSDTALLDQYVRSLFLSVVGFSVTKAGANFATVRANGVPTPDPNWRNASLVAIRASVGALAIAVAAQVGVTSQIPYASLVGVIFGAAHNALYRRFLSGSIAASVQMAVFSFAHYASVLATLVIAPRYLPVLALPALVAGLVVAITLLALLARSNTHLAIGELAYSYGYPFLIYAVSLSMTASTLWAYFVVTKVVEGVTLLINFVFQPGFFQMSADRRTATVRRLIPISDSAFLTLTLVVGACAYFESSIANDPIGASIIGFSFASGSLISSLTTFAFVCMARRQSEVLTFGVTYAVIPASVIYAFATSAYPLVGYLGAVVMLWLINGASLRRVLAINRR
jgi:hypothetical protein